MPESPRGEPSATGLQSHTSLSPRPSRIPRLRSVAPNSGPPTISNTSAGAERRRVVPFRPANAQFQDAENVVVNGGQFTNARGHHLVNNVFITLPRRETDNGGEHPAPILQPTSMSQDEQTSDEVQISESQSMPTGDGDIMTIGSNSTSLTKKCNVVYETLLAPKERGYALWIPAPNKNLPLPYQRKGIQIGDVGIITPSGGFSFIFNICVPRDNAINPPSLPEDFVPIHPPIDRIDICRFTTFNAGSYLASTSIEKSQDDTISPGLSFRASASEGAILTMPEGAVSEDFENLPRFRKYVAANVEKWYRYINGPRGREAKNGDVRLVVGCDKATSWGMATLSNVSHRMRHSQLKFKPLDAQSSSPHSCGYTWEYSGTADVKVGPDREEIEELRRGDPDDSASGDKYLNQCLFVRTLNVTLNDGDWERLNNEIAIGYTPNSITEHEKLTPSLSPSNQDHLSSPPPTSSTSSNFGTQLCADGLPSSSLGINADRLTISVTPTATVRG
ncbi:hypothetical protein M413DRAFT_81374 [Hebeloma cylindrosporum]|uniref:Uncharacterized protein n=1 Tax=Hebeloma cylindrosporum TaxID=76867 RepID=A0A0C3CWP2_HEBCY|nr:hypothetical protein M413DRAFT_81374 [Hebeloma cylindrosporum h7]